MKTNIPVIVAALLFLTLPASSALAQGTAFTYQGRLQNNGGAANGGYDLQFTLYATNTAGMAVAGPVTNLDVQVSNGLFTTTIDFGPGVFTGASNWLDIAVETNGAGPFTELTPRQQLTPVPYAQFAEGANAGRLSGTLNLSGPEITSGGGILLYASNNVGNFFVGPSAGNPTGAAQPPGDSGSFNTAFGDQALCYVQSGSENTANGYDALFDVTSGSYNTADGFEALGFAGAGQNNTAVGASALGTANGGQNTAVGTYALQGLRGGVYNIALGYDAGSAFQGSENGNIDIGNDGVAGENNIIRIGTPGTQTAAYIAGTIYGDGGGLTNLNTAQLSGPLTLAQLPASVVTANESGVTLGNVSLGIVNSSGSMTVAGPLNLTDGVINYGSQTMMYAPSPPGNFFIGPDAGAAFPPTGSFNTGVGYDALVANGGTDNTACGYEALGGNYGSYNTGYGFAALIRSTNSYNTAIGYLALNNNAGGFENTAVGANALVSISGGTNNIALGYNAGSALKTTESQNIDIGNNGIAGDNNVVRIGNFQNATYLAGTVYANGVALTSDRNAKEHFRPLDARAVLAKVAALPITEWNYKTSQNLEHIGPMAQDFHAAFGLNGPDDKHISVVDEGGVALAAIQGLNEKLETDNAALKQENNSLAKRLDELEAEVKELKR